MAVIESIVTAFRVARIAAVRAAIRAVTAVLAPIGVVGLRSKAALGWKILGVASALKTICTAGLREFIERGAMEIRYPT